MWVYFIKCFQGTDSTRKTLLIHVAYLTQVSQLCQMLVGVSAKRKSLVPVQTMRSSWTESLDFIMLKRLDCVLISVPLM